MDFSGFLVQLLNGLAGASSLFLVAVGLSLIFGVIRIVNFAHGSLYMLGIYAGYSLTEKFGGSVLGFWGCILLSAILVGVLGAVIEPLVLRRIYKAPELFQLLATFALALLIKDAALWFWGPEDLLGRRAPGLAGAVEIFGRRFPSYDIALIFIGPAVLGLLYLLLTRTRWGTLIRAATQDREMASALGVNQAWLFTGVFALGAFLAGLGGAVQLPREPAALTLDLQTIGDAFVVVVVGGMGSVPGAYVAALIIAEIKAICIGIGQVHFNLFGLAFDFSFSKLTLVLEFLVMAVVLVLRPWGLMGKPNAPVRNAAAVEAPLVPPGRAMQAATLGIVAVLLFLPLVGKSFPYVTVLSIDILTAALFAGSLFFIMGPGGMHSFGHAAYFGLGAYGAALLLKSAGLPMIATLIGAPLVAGLGALLFGWFAVRLSGVYLAMLTLAFAQIVWSIVFQWDGFTGGSNGLTGVWPAEWLRDKGAYFYLTLALCMLSLWLMRRMLFAPLGYALRAARDLPLRAEAIGINVRSVQLAAFVIAGVFCGLAGALAAFSKGSISPETIATSKSVDGLVMVLLGGVQNLAGPLVGASVFTWLQDAVIRNTEYWRAPMGAVVLFLVLAFPMGIAGSARRLYEGAKARKAVASMGGAQ